ncbi:MAG TPA: YCF48-related protein [Ignavibacteria bacterium]|nr:YCF48-related protein [Ignavibacteria bacterium]
MSKKLPIVIFLFMMFPPLLFCQSVWQRQNEFTIVGNMNDIIQFDMRKVISVGDYGQICISEDGGTTMKKIQTGFDNHFKALSFLNQNTGYVCGDGGIIIKTTNGGYNWTDLSIEIDEILYDIEIRNDDTMFTVGEKGMIYKSINGGLTWTRKNFSHDYYLLSIKFYNATTGNAVGYPGIILRTTNGGENWYNVSSNINFNRQLIDIDVRNSNGFAVGDSLTIFRTTNYGINWIRDTSSTFYHWNTPLYRVKILDSLNIVCAGADIFHSSNGGESFVSGYFNLYPFASNSIKGMSIKSKDSALICGYSAIGKTMRYSSGTYIGRIPYAVSNLHDISIIDDKNCWVLGPGYSGSQLPHIVFNTSNHGLNWHYKPVFNDSDIVFYQIKFLNKDTGYISTGKRLIKTTNAGASWNIVYYYSWSTGGYELNKLKIYDNRLYSGWGNIIYTTNDGLNWTKVPTPEYTNVHNYAIIDTNIYYTINSNYINNIHKTTNGGLNWTIERHYAYGEIKDLCFIDKFTGIFVGNNSIILKTTAFGSLIKIETGNPDPTMVFNSVHMPDSNNIFIAGNDGIIYNSTNGGYSWELQNSGVTSNLNKVEFYNDKTGWIVGDYGVILFTSTGGKSWSLDPPDTPDKFSLAQNYPNPFNSGTTISFTVPVKNRVAIRIFDAAGRKISELLNEEKERGTYKINFEPKAFASGVYFYSMSSGNFVETKRMIIIK